MQRPTLLRLVGFGLLLSGLALGVAACDSDGDHGQPPPGSQSVTVNGRVLFDSGEAVQGATVVASVVPDDAIAEVQSVQRASHIDMTTTNARGQKPSLRGEPEPASLAVTRQMNTVTDANGNFSVALETEDLPVRVLVEVSLQSAGVPQVQSAKWGDAIETVLTLGDIVIPKVENAAIAIQNGTGQNDDGSIRVENLPATVDRLFGRVYDPDAAPEAFPGEFREMGSIPLNSSVFLWMEALDADGNPVDNLGQAATIRSRIPPSQWADLEDINEGTDRIELPIYVYDEHANMWMQQTEVGWLEDGEGTVLPEDAQSVVLDGTFAGDLFATFLVDHLSWMNVDYPFIGPWTLSRISSSNRNNDCLFNAMQLAKTIAKSTVGRAAYAKVNQSGGDLDVELSDGNGPELATSDNPHPDAEVEYADYAGDRGGSETQFVMNNAIWNGCGDGATEAQQKNTTLLMAVTILHETAHWKDDVKKFPDDDTDTPGEEGSQLERDIFGGIIDSQGGMGSGGQLLSDGKPVTDAQRDQWLNPANWPVPASGSALVASRTSATRQESSSPLLITISVAQNTFELGEEIPVEVTYENVSAAPIEVMNRVVLEGWPLYFNIINQNTGERVRFLDSERKLHLTEDDFVTLEPGETMTQTVELLRDPTRGTLRYQLINAGTFEITAVHEALRGVPETRSNTIVITLNPGGSASGLVTNATNAAPLAGATIEVLQNDNVLVSATSDADGNYTVPELPAGTFTFAARAPGFLRSTRENVAITAGEQTVVNFNLSPLLTAGELRLVLTWGESPSDLDSHLWLPVDRPYHIYFSRNGGLDDCPFANLDVDDTTSFGPETITISQRFPGTYTYAVHNFSGDSDLSASGAQVQVFDTSGLIATFNVPADAAGLWWHVFDINGETGNIIEVNTVGDDPKPYEDSDMGCSAESQ